jgi:serine/threonine protein kinase
VEQLLATDRFSIRRRLGTGSFGVVFEAYDHERQSPVALKLLQEPKAATLYRFKQEFRALADLVHPNLVSPFELLSFGSQWLFTMELVPGRDFLRRLRGEPLAPGGGPGSSASHSSLDFLLYSRPASSSRDRSSAELGAEEAEEFPVSPSHYSAPPSFEPFRPLLIQLTSGLATLHRAGLLHRDIKPGNVLVTPRDEVKVLDFGLAALAAPGIEEPSGAEPVVGTLAYMAPELLAGEPGTAACDWYAVGVMLYQGLTGQMPFTGNPLEMARAKRDLDPCPPSLLVPGIPEELEALCLDLLRRDPQQRPGGEEILRRLGQKTGDLHPSSEGLPRVSSPNPVGRAREMGLLLQAFDRVREGESCIIQLRGASGLGKTFILRRFLRELQRLEPRSLLLVGRCYEQESVPFKALDSLVDSLSQHLRSLPRAEVDLLLPPHIRALARLFPVLEQLPSLSGRPGPQEETPDPLELRRRALEALRELLKRMALRQPLVLAIDDLQWGDLDSGTLLRDLMEPPEAPSLLLLLCAKADGDEASVFLNALESTPALAEHFETIELKVLPDSEAQSLALALLGPDFADPSSAAERIARESGGNPFFIGEMARQMRAGTLRGEGDLEGYLNARISELPEAARRILQVLAVAACPLPYEPLRNAAQVQEEASHAIALLRAGHLVRPLVGPRRRTLEVYHFRIREALQKSLDPEERRGIHGRLAQALEVSADSDPETLAIHFEGAGESGKAAEFAALAGEKALAALAFDRAARLFSRSLALRPPGDAAVPRLFIALGDAFAGAGRSSEAAESYMRAVERVTPDEVSRLRRRAAEEFLRSGHMELGTAVLREVLASVGASYAGSPLKALASALFFRLRVKLRGYGFRERAAESIAPHVLEEIDVLWAAAMGLGPVDILRGADFQSRHLLKALAGGEPFRIVRALAHETIFVAQHGNRSRHATQRIVSTTLALAERLGHPEALARAYIAAGIANTLQGHWRASAELLARAEALLRNHCTGVDYELHITQHHEFLARTVLGQHGEIARRLPVLLKEAHGRGDLLAITDLRTSMEVPQRLVEDDPDSARRELAEAIGAWTSMGFHTQHYHALVSGANLELYAGNPSEACRLLEDRWLGLKRSMLMQVQTISVTAWELKARVNLALAFGAAQRDRHLKAARDAMRKVAREGTDYGDALQLRLRALQCLAEDRGSEVMPLLLQAELAFEACEMSGHAMTARHARGLLGGVSDALQSGEAWLRSQGVKNPARYTGMHFPGVFLKR